MSSFLRFGKQSSRVVVLAAILFSSAYLALSQGLTGGIAGSVTDPSRAAVANANVTAKNIGTNAEATASTKSDGAYRIVGLVPGNYTVTVESPGFRKAITA